VWHSGPGPKGVTTVNGMPFRVISPASQDAWNGLRGSDSDAVISQSHQWLQAMCQASALRDASRLYQFPSGRRVLVPLARSTRVPAMVATAASWPLAWGVGGPLQDGGVIDAAEAGQVVADLARQPWLRMQLRCRHGMPTPWRLAAETAFTVVPHTVHVLALDGGFADVWKRQFTSSARWGVRKAERSGLEVRSGRTPDLFADFYELYEQSITRWAKQQHEPVALTRWRNKRANSRRTLQAVADQFGESLSIWGAYRHDEPIAAIIVLSLGSYAKYWRGAMNKEAAAPAQANNLLHRLAIEQATTAGYRRYDMGESRPDSSLARFKASFGAECHVADEYWQERAPISRVQGRARQAVKQVLGFRDV
jgi:hypothetical protein